MRLNQKKKKYSKSFIFIKKYLEIIQTIISWKFSNMIIGCLIVSVFESFYLIHPTLEWSKLDASIMITISLHILTWVLSNLSIFLFSFILTVLRFKMKMHWFQLVLLYFEMRNLWYLYFGIYSFKLWIFLKSIKEKSG